MKCYCDNCGSEFKPGDDLPIEQGQERVFYCSVCTDQDDDVAVWMKPIPDYETPSQYEKRTGKSVSDDTAVWFRRCPKTSSITDYRWGLTRFGHLDLAWYSEHEQYQLVIADPPVPPPDNWQGEGE